MNFPRRTDHLYLYLILSSFQLQTPLDDDPLKEKEAEMILEYIEKFNELFNDGEYGKAAAHASNSPQGVLRTIETFKRSVMTVLNMYKVC